jgi:hypothetical protein
MSDPTATGEALGILFANALLELAGGGKPLLVGMLRTRGQTKFDIVAIPEGEWTMAERESSKPDVQDAAWLVVDTELAELTMYLIRVPAGGDMFDAIVLVQYDHDDGVLLLSNPEFRVPPDGDEEIVFTFWEALLEGMSKNPKIETAPIEFGALGDYEDGEDDDGDGDDEPAK